MEFRRRQMEMAQLLKKTSKLPPAKVAAKVAKKITAKKTVASTVLKSSSATGNLELYFDIFTILFHMICQEVIIFFLSIFGNKFRTNL